jgi:hypothetical protein
METTVIDEKWLYGIPYILLTTRIEMEGKKYIFQTIKEFNDPIGHCYNEHLEKLKQARIKKES